MTEPFAVVHQLNLTTTSPWSTDLDNSSDRTTCDGKGTESVCDQVKNTCVNESLSIDCEIWHQRATLAIRLKV